MSQRQKPLYQGRDWFSYRWTVAQTFGLLEHLHDLCICPTTDDPFSDSSSDPSLATTFHHLCEVLGAQLAIAYADTIPQAQCLSGFKQNWGCFETRQTYSFLHQAVKRLRQENEADLDEIIALTLAIKDHLRQIDA